MKCDSLQPLQFAQEYLRHVPKEAQDAIGPRFLGLARRMKDELEGSLPKGCAGGCLMVAVKVEAGWCPPLRRLSKVMGVSPKALVQWESQVLEKLDWTLGLVADAADEAAPDPAVDWTGLWHRLRHSSEGEFSKPRGGEDWGPGAT